MSIDPAGLSLENKVALLSGRDLQSTKSPDSTGVPTVVLCDGPYGVRHVPVGDSAAQDPAAWLSRARPATCFPPGVAVGCSWDPELAARLGAAVAREARSYGVTVNLAPAMNLKRSPLCGRNFEYYAEDPLLTGVLATAYVRAVEAGGVGTSPKHFAANNQETDRMQVDAQVDERTLRELYLAAFERVVKEGRPATIMAAYNKVNGTYASEHPWLLTQVLREEWGFTGVVVSDWGAVNDRVAALRAGLDLEMPGSDGVNDAAVLAAVQSGELDASVVDESVRRLLALTERVAPPLEAFDAPSHHRLARDLATECAVLLKNDGTLPLSPVADILVVGPFAKLPRFQGGGSSHIVTTQLDAPLDAISTLTAGQVRYADGFALEKQDDADRTAMREAAVEQARTAAVTVVFAGLGDKQESEGFDRRSLNLPAAQVAVIRALAAVCPKVVVVLSHGGVVSLEGWHDDVAAILDGFLLGQGGGAALADLLFGVANPSGRLAETIPLRLQDTASYLNFPGELGTVRYGEGVLVGYRYFQTADVAVRYPFGHGLSYTTFATSDLQVQVLGDDTVEVAVMVTNTGPRFGKQVVQVYVATQAGPVRRPLRELRAFRKIALSAGEAQRITLALDRRAFAYYDVRFGDWVVAGGTYEIEIGESAADIIARASVELPGDAVQLPLTLDSTVQEWFAHPTAGALLITLLMERFAGPGGTDEAGGAAAGPGTGTDTAEVLRMISSMPMRRFALFPGVGVGLAALQDILERSESAPDQHG